MFARRLLDDCKPLQLLRNSEGCEENSAPKIVVQIAIKTERGRHSKQNKLFFDKNSFGFIGNH